MVGRHERECGRRGQGHGLGDEVRSFGGKAAEASLLPAGHEPPHCRIVRNDSARSGEREPTARALPATRHGPGGGRATAIAERWPQPRQCVATRVAELVAGAAADGAAHRQ